MVNQLAAGVRHCPAETLNLQIVLKPRIGMELNKFTEVSITNGVPNTTQNMGFSFKQSIRNKATDDELCKLGMGWVWADCGNREHLRDCLTAKGWAVTPGRWRDGWKNNHKSEFLSAHFIFLDFDGGLKLTEAVANPFVQAQAAFIYTTASHGKKPGDRFRVVFELSHDVSDVHTFNRVLTGLKAKLPGSDDAINGVSCLFGNDRAKVIDFDADNSLDVTECLDEWQRVEDKRSHDRSVKQRAATSLFQGSTNDTENNLRRWLAPVPSNGYDRWIRVGAWLKSIAYSGEISEEQGESIFMDWSIANYQGVKERRNDPNVIERTWESLTGGKNGADGWVRANGLIKIRALYHETILEQLNVISN